ncbi:MAG: hypothetical protein WCC57_08110 [Paracoccaceae bacterium]
MGARLDEMMARMAELQAGIEEDLAAKRAEFKFRIERGRAVFDAEVRKQHRALRVGLGTFLRRTRLMVVLTAPLIYGLIVPLVLLDLCVSIYQRVCFPIYGISRVKRADHIVFDRQWLVYLNLLQKMNCVYCSYGNGLISYVREIAARTEAYWCPIKHARRVAGRHDHYKDFVDYGDAEGWLVRQEALADGAAKKK